MCVDCQSVVLHFLLYVSFPPCALAVTSMARLVLTAWNEADCNYILGELLNGGFVHAGRRVWWSLSLLHMCFWTSKCTYPAFSFVCACGNGEQKAREQAQPAAHLEAVT